MYVLLARVVMQWNIAFVALHLASHLRLAAILAQRTCPILRIACTVIMQEKKQRQRFLIFGLELSHLRKHLLIKILL